MSPDPDDVASVCPQASCGARCTCSTTTPTGGGLCTTTSPCRAPRAPTARASAGGRASAGTAGSGGHSMTSTSGGARSTPASCTTRSSHPYPIPNPASRSGSSRPTVGCARKRAAGKTAPSTGRATRRS